MQVEFIRQLALAVKKGIRVIMTTHSEWVLEELANLVKMSEVPEKDRKSIDGNDLAIDPKDVGAWLFQKTEEGGSTIREISLDDEVGIFPVGYGEVSKALHNKWAKISSLINE